ncbi:MAG: Mini-ribonuclease 3 [Lachnospiraceae bacterium]
MEKSIEEYMIKELNLRELDVKTYSPLSLAYMGDCVYELFIRTILVNEKNDKVNHYHKKASALVKAKAQADLIKKLEPILTQEEYAVYKRGRNAKSITTAKNATVIDYRMATGFEALIGYLYLKKDLKRIIDLIKIGLEIGE